jgi:hypothetical protein
MHISPWELGSPLLTLTLTKIVSMQLLKQASLLTTSRPHHHATPQAKLLYVKNVLVSVPTCDIKNQKEWHWPPNTYRIPIKPVNSFITSSKQLFLSYLRDLVFITSY